MNVLVETNKELLNFRIDCNFTEDDLAMLPASKTKESQARNHIMRTLRSISNKEVFIFKLVLLCYKTIIWFMVLAVHVLMDA